MVSNSTGAVPITYAYEGKSCCFSMLYCDIMSWSTKTKGPANHYINDVIYRLSVSSTGSHAIFQIHSDSLYTSMPRADIA